MNINDYRRAVDRIAPAPALKQRIMDSTPPQRRRTPVRRAVKTALAAALVLACLLTAALAASPELRTAVLSFLHMEEHEQVPSGPGSSFDISQAEIGTLVQAQYIRLDSRRYGFSCGLLTDLTWSEDYRTLLDAKFWEINDSELVPVQVDMQTSLLDITYNGIRYQGRFYWFVREGRLDYFCGDNRCYDEETEQEWDWNLSPVPGRTDVLSLNLSTGRQMEYDEYRMLYHLDTGEVEDILAGTGVSALEYAYGCTWSEDMRRAILLTGNRLDDQLTWFCDLDTGTLVRLDELVGMEMYTAAFADSDTLILYETSRDEDGVLQPVSFYAYDIPTGHMTKTLDETPYYHYWDEQPSGVITFGSRCVLISPEGQVQVVDLKTGDRSILGGFTFQKGDEFQLNPAGDKLLYYAQGPAPDGLGIAQLGVADLEKGIFLAFDREGYENLRETSIGWADDNTVSVTADTRDSELGTRYLLLYQF